MRLTIRTLVILGGVFLMSSVIPSFVTIHPALSLVINCIFAALVPELEKSIKD